MKMRILRDNHKQFSFIFGPESISLSYIALLIFFTNLHKVYSQRPIVSTISGDLIGTTTYFYNVKLHVFLGIRYAKPPVGFLRFKKPEPLEPRHQTVNAFRLPPACYQYPNPSLPFADVMPKQSEDCLFLNVWVPQTHHKTRNGLAVLFWIHGGAFVQGSNRMPMYEGTALAAIGNVIVVTVNYRLGPFGFLASNTDDAPGNMGLYDILLALEWVNHNIQAFGGDRDRITIAGENSGSVAVSALYLSPMAKNLFQRAIMESSSLPWYLASAPTEEFVFSKAQQISSAVGCASDTFTYQENQERVLHCLRGVSAPSLVLASRRIFQENLDSPLLYKIVYGDDLLPEDPRETIIEGKIHPKQLLIGVNEDEGAYTLGYNFPDVFGLYGEKNPKINKAYGKTLIRKLFANFSETEFVVHHYLGNLAPTDYERIREQVYTSVGDFRYVCTASYFAEACADSGSEVYFYLFGYRPSTSPWSPWMKVAQFSEVPFVFGQPLIHKESYQEEEVLLSKRVIARWTTFAKTGYPGEDWQLFNRAFPTVRLLDTSVRITDVLEPHQENCDFFRPFFRLFN